ncbi:putative neutral sphingomyelinase [Tribolium madens]|uniref:putative neutral sphingomyelinase n=1 Tax=Tribolium madens TaxID=41895 RepID=UPI001CF72E21|nr:putative neutral sphingomyelinase [Tribolium madens]
MEFKVFTLNCWGLAVVSKNRRRRMQAIAEVLATSQYDVVCLQEVWLNSDFELIRNKVSGVLPYSHYFHSGVTGSGVCILSRHPMEDIFFHQWPVNGYIHKIHHGDWFGGKGVGLCKLKVNNYTVNVYSAHLHAEYDRDCDEYQAHRVLQSFDTAQFIQMTSGDADLVVLAGDLNTEPGDLAYRIMLSVPGLVDAFSEAGESVQDCVATNESLTNSYTPVALLKKNIPGKRIDYIMYHPGSNLQIDLKSYTLPLPHKIPECSFSYSDHEAIAATLIITKSEIRSLRSDQHMKKSVLEDSIEICDDALRSLNNHKYLYCFFTFVLLVLLVTTLATDLPFGYNLNFIYHIWKILITLFMFYTFMMATIWNKIERHAVIAGKLGMETALKKLKAKDM